MHPKLITVSLFSFFMSFILIAQNEPVTNDKSIHTFSVSDTLIHKDSTLTASISNKVSQLDTLVFLKNKLGDIEYINMFGKDTITCCKSDTLFRVKGVLYPVDSLKKYWNKLNYVVTAFDKYSIKIPYRDSLNNIQAAKKEFKNNQDTGGLQNEESISFFSRIISKISTNKEIIKFYLKILGILLFLALLGFVINLLVKEIQSKIKFIDDLSNKIATLENEFNKLNSQIDKLTRSLDNSNNLSNTKKSTKASSKKNKSPKEIDQIKTKVLNTIRNNNCLDKIELSSLGTVKDHRWLTIAHSAIGKNHVQANPKIPCQDNHFFDSVNDKWQLAIVCDGAGSAKLSHFGSEFIAKGALPKNVKKGLENLEWFQKGSLPSKIEWSETVIKILQNTYEDIGSWIANENEKENTRHEIKEFASTVIIALYNENGVLVANIGDGRGGFLNRQGAYKPLFTPYSGEEANGTIFITSPIWDTPKDFIQTDVIDDTILSVFLLSDGMEKTTFQCSHFEDDVFVDANTPHKKFFTPILTKMKSIANKDEEILVAEWKKYIESGTEAIRNEGDDKTLLISLLK